MFYIVFFLFSPTDSFSSTLPFNEIIDNIPRCAQSCVKAFIAREFSGSGCDSEQNLGCFCESYSTSGFTLGEGMYLCLLSDCSDQDKSEGTALYQICQNIQDAKPLSNFKPLAHTRILSIDLFNFKNTQATSERMSSSCSFQVAKNTQTVTTLSFPPTSASSTLFPHSTALAVSITTTSASFSVTTAENSSARSEKENRHRSVHMWRVWAETWRAGITGRTSHRLKKNRLQGRAQKTRTDDPIG